MKWRRRCWAAAALACLALSSALVWQHVRPMFVGVGPDEPLVPVSAAGKFGFVSARGVVAVPFEFDSVKEFDREGWTRARSDGQWGWIDRTGRRTLSFV